MLLVTLIKHLHNACPTKLGGSTNKWYSGRYWTQCPVGIQPSHFTIRDDSVYIHLLQYSFTNRPVAARSRRALRIRPFSSRNSIADCARHRCEHQYPIYKGIVGCITNNLFRFYNGSTTFTLDDDAKLSFLALELALRFLVKMHRNQLELHLTKESPN